MVGFFPLFFFSPYKNTKITTAGSFSKVSSAVNTLFVQRFMELIQLKIDTAFLKTAALPRLFSLYETLLTVSTTCDFFTHICQAVQPR